MVEVQLQNDQNLKKTRVTFKVIIIIKVNFICKALFNTKWLNNMKQKSYIQNIIVKKINGLNPDLSH